MSARLSGIAEIETPHAAAEFFHVYQMYTIKVKRGGKQRDALMAHLAKKGIMTRVYFPPIHLTHFYRHKMGYNDKLPVTERLSEQVLTLPMFPTMTEAEINCVADAIGAFFSKRNQEGKI